MAITTVIAFEDDALHAEMLKMNMDILGYQLAGIHPDATEAVKFIAATSPDVILMDIDLEGDVTGIQAAQKINSIFNIPVIYLTSLPTHTILDDVKATFPDAYLPKPYTLDQLRSAIEIAVFKHRQILQRPGQQSNFRQSEFLYVKVDNILSRLSYFDIHYIEAYDKYCFIHMAGKKHLVSIPLKQLLQKLPSALFIQVHRSYVINMQFIESVRSNQNAIVTAGRLIPYSKTYKHELYERLNII